VKITHNNLNDAISEMEDAVKKGQMFAKRNKDRRIRYILRVMRAEQAKAPAFRDVWYYFKIWLTMWLTIKARQVEDYFNHEI